MNQIINKKGKKKKKKNKPKDLDVPIDASKHEEINLDEANL